MNSATAFLAKVGPGRPLESLNVVIARQGILPPIRAREPDHERLSTRFVNHVSPRLRGAKATFAVAQACTFSRQSAV